MAETNRPETAVWAGDPDMLAYSTELVVLISIRLRLARHFVPFGKVSNQMIRKPKDDAP